MNRAAPTSANCTSGSRRYPGRPPRVAPPPPEPPASGSCADVELELEALVLLHHERVIKRRVGIHAHGLTVVEELEQAHVPFAAEVPELVVRQHLVAGGVA